MTPVTFICTRCGGKAVRMGKSARYCLDCSVKRDAARSHSERSKAKAAPLRSAGKAP